jgi:hypothetical protein
MQYIFQDLFYLFFKKQILIISYDFRTSQVAPHGATPLFLPEPNNICKGFLIHQYKIVNIPN